MDLFVNLVLIINATVALVFGISFYLREKNKIEIRRYITYLSISACLTCGGYGLMSFSPNFKMAFFFREMGLLGIEMYLLCIMFFALSDMKRTKKYQRIFHTVFMIFAVIDYVSYGHPDTITFIRTRNFITFVSNDSIRLRFHYGYMLFIFVVDVVLAVKWYMSMKYKREKRFVITIVGANCILLFGGALDAIASSIGFETPSFFYSVGVASSFFVCWYAANKKSVFVISVQSMSENIFDFINTAILVFDFEKKLSLANPYAKKLLELDSEQDILPKDIFELDDKMQMDIFAKAQQGVTKRYRLKSNTNQKSCQVTCQAKIDDHEEPVCLIMIVTDMTKEEQLIREADRANRAKSIFLAQMSHEIRTPLNTVLGMNEMILRESTEPKTKEYSKDIQGAGKQLLQLINKILDFTKIEDGKMELVLVKYNMKEALKDILHSISLKAQEKGLEFFVQIDPTIPNTLYGDDLRIRQIISNLLTNAVKYTQNGSISLLIKQIRNNGREVELYVEVSDTGVGIRSEDKAKVFKGFYRLDEEKNRGIEGTGLGMSIVSQLLQLMGSELKLESVYGEGTTFSFAVTQQIIDEQSMEQDMIEEDDCESYLYTTDAKILVVDDNEMNLKVARNLMRINGIIPDTTNSGSDAIRMAREKEYHIIFMDDMMSGMSGAETLEQMKTEQIISASTKVVAFTANAIVGAREEYLKAGFHDYLSKPIDYHVLEQMLAKYLPANIVTKRNIHSKTKEIEYKKEDKQINYAAGMKLCMNDKEFYREMVETLMSSASEQVLQGYFEEKDWENYRIKVHSLKSNLLNIGAEKLSEDAKKLEFALKAGEIDYVIKNHMKFIESYRCMLKEIEKYIK